MQNILIVGASSAIAEALAKEYAVAGKTLFLCARNQDTLERNAADLKVRGARNTFCFQLDMNDYQQQQAMLDQVKKDMGHIDTLIVAHGTLPDQTACQDSVEATLHELNTNALSTIALLTLVANSMEAAGKGNIAVIGSVAGDRGRQSNYVYGTAKAAVATFLSGLRNRLSKRGVNVLTIKPGFVDTPMTAEFDKGPLWATPEAVAKDIVKAISKGKNTLYTPWFWQIIMLIIRTIPESIFKKLSL
jgi:short-subunit dehydrogenase